ncbi:MAG: IPT/TIG domain-containing protein, partial [Candidatus Nomurabacteria bacterium]|nr:IPT/TIG domain-containing protein [Candidatus Nomurabacteria bacterium]
HENAADLDNDFPFLNAKMYDPTATTGSTFGSTAYGANWWSNGSFRGVASGQYYNASPTLQSEQGLFWSSNVYTGDAGSARVFKFASNGVGFGYVTRNYGLAVRCVDDENYIPELITVTFDGIPATVVSHTDTKIVVKTPSHIAGLVNVTVSNGLSTDTLPPVYIDAGGDLTDFTNVSTGYLYQEPYVALTVDTNNLTIGGSPITPSISGTYAHSPNTTSVKTNYLLGYNLTLSTNLPNSNTHASDLKETTAIPDRYLIGTTNTCTWNTTTKTLDNTTSTILNNTWGFTINSSDLTAQKLCRVPNQNNPLTIKSTNAPMETNPGDQTTFYYGTKLDYNQAAGIYRTTVVYTAVGNI